MKIFNFDITRRKEVLPETPKDNSFHRIEFARPEIPVIKEVKGKDYVYFGLDNLYPQKLVNLLATSAIHYAIVDGKAKMMAGDGYLYNDTTTAEDSLNAYNALPSNVKAELDNFLDNPNGNEDMEEIIEKIAKDYQIHGSMALEVVWSMDFTRIATIKYVDVATVRSGKLHNGEICEYYISRRWENISQYPVSCIAAFDPENKEHYNQLIFVSNGNLEYYGEAPYLGSMVWIDIDARMGTFHNSVIQNGFAPSIAIKFYQKPDSPEKEKMIVNQINKQYTGETKAGKGMVFFSDGKDLAPDIQTIETTNLDKQYIALSDLAVQNILTGAKVTSPALFGIQTPGSLSQGTELAIAYNIFNKSVIAPERKKIEKILNKILKINNIPVKIELNPFNPLV